MAVLEEHMQVHQPNTIPCPVCGDTRFPSGITVTAAWSIGVGSGFFGYLRIIEHSSVLLVLAKCIVMALSTASSLLTLDLLVLQGHLASSAWCHCVVRLHMPKHRPFFSRTALMTRPSPQ